MQPDVGGQHAKLAHESCCVVERRLVMSGNMQRADSEHVAFGVVAAVDAA